jgi:hypothetical protein
MNEEGNKKIIEEGNNRISNFGFILTRHVNSEKTNKYWNKSVKCIRRFYPSKKIVIIDDNSKKEFVKAFAKYDNVEIIQSEFPGRGELLPFVYFLKHKFFSNAVIIHDSVFFHKKINFNKFRFPVIPFWHFNRFLDQEECKINNLKIAQNLHNNGKIMENLKNILKNNVNSIISWKRDEEWNGCFGVQCFINYHFLKKIEEKYKITGMLNHVKNRTDRSSLERIMGIIFSTEYPEMKIYKSLLGDIFTWQNFGYSFDEYNDDFNKKKIVRPIIKVWTGR